MRSSEIMEKLPLLAISAGSACHSKGVEPSYVLRALGQSEEEAGSAVRFSWGKFTTKEDIEIALEQLKALEKFQSNS